MCDLFPPLIIFINVDLTLNAGNNLKCLLVRQPYASLIAYGSKRMEFRNHPSKIEGEIAIASSRGVPFKTTDKILNKNSKLFPRGKILSIGTIKKSFFIDNKELKKYYNGQESKKIHGINLELAKLPLGEPVSDIRYAIINNKWSCFVWELTNVKPIEKPIELISIGHGPWIALNNEEESNILKSL